MRAALLRVQEMNEHTGRTLALVERMIQDYKAAPREVIEVVEAAKATFDQAPISIWCKYEDGTNVYSNPHYRQTILDYQGETDLNRWGAKTGGQFRANDTKAAEDGGLLVHEQGWNPTAGRHEHWWIAKWRQIVTTSTGPRTLVWGVLLSTVVGHGQRPDS